MQTAAAYRQSAYACLVAARTTYVLRARVLYLSMADSWISLARAAESDAGGPAETNTASPRARGWRQRDMVAGMTIERPGTWPEGVVRAAPGRVRRI